MKSALFNSLSRPQEQPADASNSSRERNACPLIAVVVVGYNNKELLPGCLGSLLRLDYEPVLIIYVDNDSTDGSLDFVRSAFPQVVAIHSGGNLGYCGGNNRGIEYALGADASFVLILNPDTIVHNTRFLGTLLEYFQRNPSVGKVGPTVYLREAGQIQNTILSWPSVTRSVYAMLKQERPQPGPPRSATITSPTQVPSLNGCCVLVRSQALHEVGLYDEAFWCYIDEADWDWRAEQRGWTRHYFPVESIVHLQREDGYAMDSRVNFLLKRNTALWFFKTGKICSLVFWIFATLAIAVIRTMVAPLRGRSFGRHGAFLLKLARVYSSILCAVPGRVFGTRGIADLHSSATAKPDF